MTGELLPLRCQMGDCGNRAALTVTLELPVEWSESPEYNVRTVLVAVCGDCAGALEADARALLEARVRYGRQQAKVEDLVRLMTLLVSLIEAVGPPFEPVQGGVFAGWLAALDKSTAQGAWRLLAEVKRRATGGRRNGSGSSVERGSRDGAPTQPLSSEAAWLRRQIVVPPIDPGPPGPPASPSPGGGDDAA